MTVDQDAAVALEFRQLHRESTQLFSQLRLLPAHGDLRQWHQTYQLTFRCMTRLWQHQQRNRNLISPEQVGDICSRIAQTYHHYYLRTGRRKHLADSVTFWRSMR